VKRQNLSQRRSIRLSSSLLLLPAREDIFRLVVEVSICLDYETEVVPSRLEGSNARSKWDNGKSEPAKRRRRTRQSALVRVGHQPVRSGSGGVCRALTPASMFPPRQSSPRLASAELYVATRRYAETQRSLTVILGDAATRAVGPAGAQTRFGARTRALAGFLNDSTRLPRDPT